MLADERKRQILDLIGRDGRAVASELSQRFGVSEDTIRRDLRELSGEGLLRRVHGGALSLPKPPIQAEYAARAEQSTAAKTAIGRAAAQLIREGQVITIDGGTTPLEVAEHLPNNLQVTVVTHSLPVLRALAYHPRIELIAVGGKVIADSLVAASSITVDTYRSIRADACIIGVAGIDVDAGLTALNYEEALVKRAMCEHAASVIGVATADKLGTAGPFAVVPVGHVTHLVTESNAEDRFVRALKDANVKVITA